MPGPDISLLEKKYSLLCELLDISREAAITAPAKDSDPGVDAAVFVSLYEKREPLFAELNRVQADLPPLPLTGDGKTLSDKCDAVTRKIIELDKRNLELGNETLGSIKDNIKRINVTRNINLKYSTPNVTNGHVLDNRN